MKTHSLCLCSTRTILCSPPLVMDRPACLGKLPDSPPPLHLFFFVFISLIHYFLSFYFCFCFCFGEGQRRLLGARLASPEEHTQRTRLRSSLPSLPAPCRYAPRIWIRDPAAPLLGHGYLLSCLVSSYYYVHLQLVVLPSPFPFFPSSL